MRRRDVKVLGVVQRLEARTWSFTTFWHHKKSKSGSPCSLNPSRGPGVHGLPVLPLHNPSSPSAWFCLTQQTLGIEQTTKKQVVSGVFDRVKIFFSLYLGLKQQNGDLTVTEREGLHQRTTDINDSHG